MEGSVQSFLKTERKVSDTGSVVLLAIVLFVLLQFLLPIWYLQTLLIVVYLSVPVPWFRIIHLEYNV